jgi:catechol 2,3-dioxygenase-like lactoylglutathione lyase family enzyme
MYPKSLFIGILSGIILTSGVFYFVFLSNKNESQGSISETTDSGALMKIKLTSVFVNDQEKSLKFYTEKLGFIKKTDLPAGEYKWLTVVSPEDPDGTELLLEPNANAAAKTYQEKIYKAGIPAAAFAVDDIQKVYNKLKKSGVVFTMDPVEMGESTAAIFDDTCGNLIQIYQM